jgi:hypothetical protein
VQPRLEHEAIVGHPPVLADIAVVVGEDVFELGEDLQQTHPLEKRGLNVALRVGESLRGFPRRFVEAFESGEAEDARGAARRAHGARRHVEAREVLDLARLAAAAGAPRRALVGDIPGADDARLMGERRFDRRAQGRDGTDGGHLLAVLEESAGEGALQTRAVLPRPPGVLEGADRQQQEKAARERPVAVRRRGEPAMEEVIVEADQHRQLQQPQQATLLHGVLPRMDGKSLA